MGKLGMIYGTNEYKNTIHEDAADVPICSNTDNVVDININLCYNIIEKGKVIKICKIGDK